VPAGRVLARLAPGDPAPSRLLFDHLWRLALERRTIGAMLVLLGASWLLFAGVLGALAFVLDEGSEVVAALGGMAAVNLTALGIGAKLGKRG
jgi:hypothetical protein